MGTGFRFRVELAAEYHRRWMVYFRELTKLLETPSIDKGAVVWSLRHIRDCESDWIVFGIDRPILMPAELRVVEYGLAMVESAAERFGSAEVSVAHRFIVAVADYRRVVGVRVKKIQAY